MKLTDIQVKNLISNILNEGYWGHLPLQNDSALDEFGEVAYNNIGEQLKNIDKNWDNKSSVFTYLGVIMYMLQIYNFFYSLKSLDKKFDFTNKINKAIKYIDDEKFINEWTNPDEVKEYIKKLPDTIKEILDKNSLDSDNFKKLKVNVPFNEGKNYVNMDVDVRDGGRHAVKMSVEDFKQEMIHAYHMYAMEQEKKYKFDLHLTPTPDSFVYSLCYKNGDNKKSKYASALYDDIWDGKYKFDSENVDAYGGIKMSKKGFPYIQCAAGGDWECPVCFFVYFDGNKFRGYVPLKGNALNRNEKHAFSGGGNEPDAKFVQKELGIGYEEADHMCGDIDYNVDACLEDFLSRVEVKGTYKKRDYTKDEETFKQYRKEKIADEKKRSEEAEIRRQMNTQENNGEPDDSEEINEAVRNILNKFASPYILNESQESKSIDAAKRLFMQRTGKSAEEADKFVRVDLRNDLPVLRDKNGAKFILGVTRMFLDRQLTDASTIQNLNKTLKLITQAHFNEYDRNLNGMSVMDLIDRFAESMKRMSDAEREELASQQFTVNENYQIVMINNFEQSSQYGKYTSWCVTHQKDMFNHYTHGGLGQFYFCLRNGFENELKQTGEGCPLDSYGLSMVAVSVDEDGQLNTCTCRWNHDNGGNDNIMDVKQISQLIGRNFYEVFKPNGKWAEKVNDAMSMLNRGETPANAFDWADDIDDKYYIVSLAIVNDEGDNGDNEYDENGSSKSNILDYRNNSLVLKKWMDTIEYCEDGLFRCELMNECKCNIFNINTGKWLLEKWADTMESNFDCGFIRFDIQGKCNWIDKNGRYLSDQWFDDAGSFHEGFANVKLEGKGWNLIDTNCKYVLNRWYEYCSEVINGFTIVGLDGKRNYINMKTGKLVLKDGFDMVYPFNYNGLGIVEIRRGNKYMLDDSVFNVVDTNGNLLLPNWSRDWDMVSRIQKSNSRPPVNEIVRNILNKFVFEDGGGAVSDCGGGRPGEFVAPAFGGSDKDFVEPALDRTPGDTMGMHDRVGKSNLEEKRKKVVKNDEGKVVPEFCKKCGGKVGTYICGEPIYKCSECGEYYGTVPFTLGRKKK